MTSASRRATFTGEVRIEVGAAHVLPIQHNGRRAWTPEQRLLCAVVEQALVDLHSPRPVRRSRTGSNAAAKRIQADAVRWFAGGEPGPLGFAFVCDALGLDLQAVRERLGVDVEADALPAWASTPATDRAMHGTVRTFTGRGRTDTCPPPAEPLLASESAPGDLPRTGSTGDAAH